jgi:LytR cell envelope-related transcriptional attenuator
VTERRSRGLSARLEGVGAGAGDDIAEEDGTRDPGDAPDLLTELLGEEGDQAPHDGGTRARRGLRAWLRARRARRAAREAQAEEPAAKTMPGLLEELLEPDRAASDISTPDHSPTEPDPEAGEAPLANGDVAPEPPQMAAPPRGTAGARPRRRWFGRRRAAHAGASPDLLEELLHEPATSEESTDPEVVAKDPVPGPAGPRVRSRGRHSVRAAPEEEQGTDGDGDGASREALERFSLLPVAAGSRRAARQRRRTRVRRRLLALLVVVALGAAGVGISLLDEGAGRDSRRADPALVPTVADDVTTTLVFGTSAGPDGSPDGVIWMSLLSLNETGGEGSVVYVPAHTATEVPGRGLLGLGESLTSGGIPLLLVSTEALLGVPVDHYLALSAEDAGRLFDTIGEITVDVPAEVSVTAGRDQARVLFEPGPQSLPADSLVELLFTTGIGGDDAELGGRHLAFWGGLFQEFSVRPAALSAALRDAAPALRDTDLEPDELARFVGGLAELSPDARTLANLPAQQVSVGGEQLYQVDEEQVAEFIAHTVGGTDEFGDAARVQILNGNGVPGIGQAVAQRLMGEGFRVILSGNARDLNTQKTRIVSYDQSVAGLQTAERAQRLLGVGEVQVSSQGQGIVDLTIVVGKDFLRKS